MCYLLNLNYKHDCWALFNYIYAATTVTLITCFRGWRWLGAVSVLWKKFQPWIFGMFYRILSLSYTLYLWAFLEQCHEFSSPANTGIFLQRSFVSYKAYINPIFIQNLLFVILFCELSYVSYISLVCWKKLHLSKIYLSLFTVNQHQFEWLVLLLHVCHTFKICDVVFHEWQTYQENDISEWYFLHWAVQWHCSKRAKKHFWAGAPEMIP